MGAVVQISCLLCICVILYLSEGQSEVLYPDVKCYQGFREDLYDAAYVQSVHDQCSTEEKRRRIMLNPEKNFTQYSTYRGCIMAIYWYALPFWKDGKIEIEFYTDDFYATTYDILVARPFQFTDVSPEADAYKHITFSRLMVMGEKITNDCNKTAEEAKRRPDEQWTELYDCIDDILVCKDGKAWIQSVDDSTLDLED